MKGNFNAMGNKYAGSISISTRTQNGKKYKYYLFSWYDEEGNHHTKTFPYHPAGKRLAIAFQKEIGEKLKKGLPVNRMPTLGSWVTEYLSKVKRPVLKESTLERYVDAAKRLKEIWDCPLDMLTPIEIQRVYDVMLAEGLSTSSVHNLHTVLSTSCKNAVANGLIEKAPTAAVVIPPVERREDIHIFTYREIRLIFGTLRYMRMGKGISGKRFRSPHDYSLFFWILLTTGMRVAELFALEWKGVDLENRIIHVYQIRSRKDSSKVEKPKTKAGTRKIPIISDAVIKRLSRIKKTVSPDARFIFAAQNSNGQRMLTEQNVLRIWRRVSKEAHVKQPKGQALHALRHTFASFIIRFYADVIPLSSLSRILGHSRTSITLNIYQHHISDDNERILHGFGKI